MTQGQQNLLLLTMTLNISHRNHAKEMNVENKMLIISNLYVHEKAEQSKINLVFIGL